MFNPECVSQKLYNKIVESVYISWVSFISLMRFLLEKIKRKIDLIFQNITVPQLTCLAKLIDVNVVVYVTNSSKIYYISVTVRLIQVLL